MSFSDSSTIGSPSDTPTSTISEKSTDTAMLTSIPIRCLKPAPNAGDIEVIIRRGDLYLSVVPTKKSYDTLEKQQTRIFLVSSAVLACASEVLHRLISSSSTETTTDQNLWLSVELDNQIQIRTVTMVLKILHHQNDSIMPLEDISFKELLDVAQIASKFQLREALRFAMDPVIKRHFQPLVLQEPLQQHQQNVLEKRLFIAWVFGKEELLRDLSKAFIELVQPSADNEIIFIRLKMKLKNRAVTLQHYLCWEGLPQELRDAILITRERYVDIIKRDFADLYESYVNEVHTNSTPYQTYCRRCVNAGIPRNDKAQVCDDAQLGDLTRTMHKITAGGTWSGIWGSSLREIYTSFVESGDHMLLSAVSRTLQAKHGDCSWRLKMQTKIKELLDSNKGFGSLEAATVPAVRWSKGSRLRLSDFRT